MTGYDPAKYHTQSLTVHVDGIGYVQHIKVRRWDSEGNIPWDDLQQIKNELAGPYAKAIEIYPAVEDLVYEENIRHLWVIPDYFPLPNIRR